MKKEFETPLNTIDAAFIELLYDISKKRGFSIKNIFLNIRFLGENQTMDLNLMTEYKNLKVQAKELITSKMTALRISLTDLFITFKTFHIKVMDEFNIDDPSKVELCLYESPKHKRPLLVANINGEFKNVVSISNLYAMLNMGDENLN